MKNGYSGTVRPGGMGSKNLIDDDYIGKILNGKYSSKLKNRVSEAIDCFHAFEKTGIPLVVYLAAWKEGDKTIWYEYVTRHFVDLMGCAPTEINGVFRNSVIDSRVYKYLQGDDDIEKDIISRRELSVSRNKFRQEGKKKGTTEAVYKIFREEGRALWLKDQAKIETYSKDKICLSFGHMMDISKEMEDADENERLVSKLEKALKKSK